MLLEHGELGLDPACLAHVDGLRQAIRGPEGLPTRSESFPPRSAIGSGGLGLHPVEQGKAEFLGSTEVARRLGGVDPENRADPVVVLGPVDEGQVLPGALALEVGGVEQATVGEEIEAGGLGSRGIEGDRPFLEGDGVGHVPAQQPARPRRPQVREVVPPEGVVLRLGDRVVRSGIIIHGEAPGDRLLVEWVGNLGGMGLPGVVAGLGADDEFGPGQGQQIPQFRGVDEVGSLDVDLSPGVEAADPDGLDHVTVCLGGDRDVLEPDLEFLVTEERRQHPVDHSEGHPGLQTEP